MASIAELAARDLLITAGDAPIALAGVMGGGGTKVDANTTSILLRIGNLPRRDDPSHEHAAGTAQKRSEHGADLEKISSIPR